MARRKSHHFDNDLSPAAASTVVSEIIESESAPAIYGRQVGFEHAPNLPMPAPLEREDPLLALAKDAEAKRAQRDRIKIFERRLQNPNGQTTAPIDLKDPSLVCRWVNSAIAADKVWRAKQQGWQPVRPEDLADLDQVGGFTKSADGFVTRGDRGQEVLMSMPKVWRDKIAMAKTRENLKNMGDPQATKNEVVQAASDRLGDQAADYLNRKVNIVGGVRDQHEIVQRDSHVLE